MYVITVLFEVHEASAERFSEAIQAQARNSLDRETACRVFDVCRDPADANRFFLYEVYDDRAAFEAHLASDHFRAFDATVAEWVAVKTVEAWERLPS